MPPTRALRALGPVTNSELVAMIVAAARMAARRVRWPDELPPDLAPLYLHAYARHHMRYKAEPASRQTVRWPSASVKTGVGDCKSTAVLIAAGSAAAGRSVALRFIKQRPGPWSHVYAVVDGVPVDPLLQFGQEALHLDRLDVPIT